MRYTEFIISPNTKLRLRLTLESMVMLERVTGESPLVTISRMGTSEKNWSRESCINILDYAILEPHSYDDTVDWVEEFIINGNTDEDLAILLIQLFKDSGFYNEHKDTENNSSTNKADNINKKAETFEESLTDFLKGCMRKGINEDTFWSSTYGELMRQIESIKDSEMDESRQKAFFDYRLANLIGISIGRLMSKEVEFPDIEKIYPELFSDEKTIEERRKAEEKRKAQQIRARLLEYASWHNNKMQKRKLKEEENKNEKED